MNNKVHSQLSKTLHKQSWAPVVYTTENHGSLVMPGKSNSCDRNNGICVIYDEYGNPWIKPNRAMVDADHALISKFKLRIGVYVPHSNGGSTWVHEHQLFRHLYDGQRGVQ